LDGIFISVFDINGASLTTVDPNMRVTFIAPTSTLENRLLVLHWDESLNQGQGGWVVLELTGIDSSPGMSP